MRNQKQNRSLTPFVVVCQRWCSEVRKIHITISFNEFMVGKTTVLLHMDNVLGPGFELIDTEKFNLESYRLLNLIGTLNAMNR